jgi:hypothetical protein
MAGSDSCSEAEKKEFERVRASGGAISFIGASSERRATPVAARIA